MAKSNREIFLNPIFDVPKRRGSISISTFITEMFSDFLKEIKKFNGSVADKLHSNLSVIKLQTNLIAESLDLYLKGRTASSYQKLKECHDELNRIGVLPIQELPKIGSKNLYRLRV